MNITDILHTTHLPAADIAEAVNEALSTHTQLVVTAPPGAGKSTLLPLTILNALKEGGRVLMLEPRPTGSPPDSRAYGHPVSRACGPDRGVPRAV